jgi:hypothetical protein
LFALLLLPDLYFGPPSILHGGFRILYSWGMSEWDMNLTIYPSAEFKFAWSYVSIHPLVFMTWYLIKHKG